MKSKVEQRLELAEKESQVSVTVKVAIDGSYGPTNAHLICSKITRLMTADLEIDEPAKAFTNVLPTRDKKLWVISFLITCKTVEQVDSWLEELVTDSKIYIGAYAEQNIAEVYLYEVYKHFKDKALNLPVAEVLSWIVPDFPVSLNREYGKFTPFKKTYKSIGTVEEDWLSANQHFKPVIARNVFMDERYDDFIAHILNTTGEDLSDVPRSWVFKAFNFSFNSEETIPGWTDQDDTHSYLKKVEKNSLEREKFNIGPDKGITKTLKSGEQPWLAIEYSLL